MTNTAPMQVNPQLTAIAISYKNRKLIADEVLPRVKVGTQDFNYAKRTKSDQFTIPSTAVSRKGQPDMVETGGVLTPVTCKDHGLRDFVPVGDVENAKGAFDPISVAAELVVSLVDLAREVRVASMVFNPSNYAAANRVQLEAADQFNDGASDPITTIMTGLDSCLMRPNKMVIGRAAYSKLCTHPLICKAVHGNSGDAGIATRQAIANLFELDDVLIGEAWVNSAKKGQAEVMARAWGKHVALIYADRTSAMSFNGTVFGFTGEFLGKQVYSWFDRQFGSRGGTTVQVADSVAEVICANDLGYFIEDACA